MKTINDNASLKGLMDNQINAAKKADWKVLEMEAMLQAYDNTVNAWSGKNRGIGDLKIPDMKFEERVFDSQSALDSYISDPNYGKADHPAVCFGF